MRQASTAALAGLVVVLAAALFAAAAPGASPVPRVRVTFSGSATGKLADVERWILLEENECYLRRARDQQVQVSWSATWTGAFGGTMRPGAVTGSGQVAGTEVRDICGADEDPPDLPEDWNQTLDCSDALTAAGGATAAWTGKATRSVLDLRGPSFALGKDAVCSAIPRSTELTANIPLKRTAIQRLRIGASLTIPLGTTFARFGDYTPNANCQHSSKPYDGYRSEDTCADQFTWTGSLRVTRIR